MTVIQQDEWENMISYLLEYRDRLMNINLTTKELTHLNKIISIIQEIPTKVEEAFKMNRIEKDIKCQKLEL